jgi:hypothetical protein
VGDIVKDDGGERGAAEWMRERGAAERMSEGPIMYLMGDCVRMIYI